MSLNNLKNLALAATLAVSAAGLFPDSALARRARYSGGSDGPERAEFIIDSNKNDNLSEAVRDISFTNPEGIFFESSIGSIENRILLNTPEELDNFLSTSGLSSLGVVGTVDSSSSIFVQQGKEPVVAYVINLSNDLVPNDDATLTLFYDDEAPEPDLSLTDLENLTTSLDGLVAFEEVRMRGFLVRNFKEEFDLGQRSINGLVVDTFFLNVKKVPEPTTTASLFIVCALGGLSMLKRNRRVNKSKAMVEN